MHRAQFVKKLDEILGFDLVAKAQEVDTRMPNGLQVPGQNEIKKVVSGVSISAALIDAALEQEADTIITHHGLSFSLLQQCLTPVLTRRLRLLLANDINLFGYHYVLDAHPTLGNNAQLLTQLGAKIHDTYFDDWGFIGKLKQPTLLSDLSEQLKELVDHDVFVIDAGLDKIQTLGVVTGRGLPSSAAVVAEMLQHQVDAHITGEISEWNVHQFLELGISFLAAGHYATETLGIKALTQKLASELKGEVKISFVDIPNPV